MQFRIIAASEMHSILATKQSADNRYPTPRCISVAMTQPSVTPFAELFAVVFQRVIAIFARPQAGPVDYFLVMEITGSIEPNAGLAPLREL